MAAAAYIALFTALLLHMTKALTPLAAQTSIARLDAIELSGGHQADGRQACHKDKDCKSNRCLKGWFSEYNVPGYCYEPKMKRRNRH